jgi:hypothetical protein
MQSGWPRGSKAGASGVAGGREGGARKRRRRRAAKSRRGGGECRAAWLRCWAPGVQGVSGCNKHMRTVETVEIGLWAQGLQGRGVAVLIGTQI